MGFTKIRDIKAGKGQVWARDAVSGKMGYRTVEAHYSNPYDVTVKVSIRDAETGKTQTLVSNKIHPFFVQLPQGVAAPPSSEGHSYTGDIARGAWVDASNLKAGYRLLNDDSSWAVVTAIKVEAAPLTAYNMKVSEYHTYFVTGDINANPVWVHNDCNLLGANGTQTTSTTVFKSRTDAGRIDVENPAPGVRSGQIHYQIGDQKYLYDVSRGAFINAPRAVNDLLSNAGFRNGIKKALKYLGEKYEN